MKAMLPYNDEQTGSWKNLDVLYMKTGDGNRLEFDLDIDLILPVIDNVEFLANKSKGETTYREQPYYYQARVAVVSCQ